MNISVASIGIAVIISAVVNLGNYFGSRSSLSLSLTISNSLVPTEIIVIVLVKELGKSVLFWIILPGNEVYSVIKLH